MFGSFAEPFNFNLNVRKLVVRNFNISPRLAATNVACVWKIGKYTQIIRVPRPWRHLLCDLRHQLHAPAAESSRLDREPVNAQTQSANCLHLNLSKTTENGFQAAKDYPTYFHLPPAVGDIDQAVNYWESFFSLILKCTLHASPFHPYELWEYCTNMHKSPLLCTFDFFNICELSFNRDFAPC